MKAGAERQIANLQSNYKWLLVGSTTDKFYCISHLLIYTPLKLFKNLAPKIWTENRWNNNIRGRLLVQEYKICSVSTLVAFQHDLICKLYRYVCTKPEVEAWCQRKYSILWGVMWIWDLEAATNKTLSLRTGKIHCGEFSTRSLRGR